MADRECILFKDICNIKREVNLRTLEEVILLAVELAREGREGKKVGTIFVVSDSEEVLKRSKPMILDPIALHPPEKKQIADPEVRETLKELAQLDGAFVISDEGIALSACRYLDADSVGIHLPLGLGSRHIAAASITRDTQAVAVVLSETSIVRVFDNGEIISQIIPEVWLLHRHGLHIAPPYLTRTTEDLTIVSKQERERPEEE